MADLILNDLTDKWDNAADLIDDDPMRPIRYGMGLRYIKNFDKDIKILDLGCGEGSGLSIIHQFGYDNLYGAEVSPERAKRARLKLNEKVSIISIEPDKSLPYQDSYFDLVTSFGVIEHASEPDFFMSEISRVLKTGGHAIISSDCFTWRILQILGLYKSVQPLDKAMTIGEFKNIFQKNGFTILHIDTFNWPERGNLYKHHAMLVTGSIIKKLTGSLVSGNRTIGRERCTNIYEKAQVISENKKANYSHIYKLSRNVSNYLDDENIFYIKKTV